MPVDALLGRFAEVVPEVPPVGDLESLRGAAGGAFGVEDSAVVADDLNSGPLGQPGRERLRISVRQEIHRPTCLDVNEDRSVDPALALSVFVHANRAGCGVGGSGSEVISLSSVFRLTRTPKASDMRAPTRPASARPTETSADRSRSVRRPNRRVSPGTCSTNVVRGQDSSAQTNRRTRNGTTTSLPAVGRSQGNRR